MGIEFVAADVCQCQIFEKIYVFILENDIYHFECSPTYLCVPVYRIKKNLGGKFYIGLWMKIKELI